MKRLAIITTHPIQYNAPLFKLLQERGAVKIKVFYTWGDTVLENKFDPGFGRTVNWDIPLLEGYEYCFEKNISGDPGSHHFRGINNPGLVEHISQWNADAVLVYGWSFKSHLKCIRYFKNKLPIFFRGDSTLLNESPGIKKILRRVFLKWVYRHIDYALYAGLHNRDYFKIHGLAEKQLIHLPHVIDNDRFFEPDTIYQKASLEWKKDLDIPVNAVVFLYAGKLDPVKDLSLLLEAFSSIQNKKAHLLIAGNGLLENELKKKYADNQLIHFIPFQNQAAMPVIYRLCDVFVLPSKSETWGLSINEAMACSRAVLVSNKCGAAIDLVKPGNNGYIFNAGNKEELVEKMNLLAGNKEMLLQMGQASRSIIDDWSLNKAAGILEKTINSILIK